MAGAVEGVTNLLSFLGEGVRGATQVPRGYREGGVGGAVQAFINPQGPEFRDRVQRLQTEEAGRLGGIQDLIDSGVYDEALTQGLTARQQLRAIAPVEVADAVVGPFIQEAGQRMLGRVMQTAPEKRSQEYANLAGFLSGSPEGALAAGKGIAQIRQGESAANLNQAGAERVAALAPEEVNLTKARTGEVESRADLNRRTPMRGYGYGGGYGVGGKPPDERLIRSQINAGIAAINKQLGTSGNPESFRPQIDQLNALSDMLGPDEPHLDIEYINDPANPKMTMAQLKSVQRAKSPGGLNSGSQVPGNTPESEDTTAKLFPDAPPPAPPPEVLEKPPTQPQAPPTKARAKAAELFGDIIDSARGTQGNFPIDGPAVNARIAEAGFQSPEQVQALRDALLKEIEEAQTGDLSTRFGVQATSGGGERRIPPKRPVADQPRRRPKYVSG